MFGQIYFISRINLNPGSARIFSTFEWIVISAQLGSTGFTVTGSMNPKFFQFTETTSRLSLKDFKEIRLIFFWKKNTLWQFFRRFRSQRPEICPRGLGFRISSRHHRQKLRHKNLFRKLLMRNRYFFFKFLGFFRNLQKSHFRKLKTPFVSIYF